MLIILSLLFLIPALSFAMDQNKIANVNPELEEIAVNDAQLGKCTKKVDCETAISLKSQQNEAKKNAEIFSNKSTELKQLLSQRNRKLDNKKTRRTIQCVLCLLCPFTCGISLFCCPENND